MYTLVGYKGSGSAAIECALTLADQPFRLVEAASWDADSDLAELTRLNPLQQIPTLVTPAGTVMSESAAMLVHLGLAHPASGLLPADAEARAAVLRGLTYIAANCYSAISISDYPERWLAEPGEAAAANLRRGTLAQLYRHWEVFAGLYTATPHLHGAEPGALDLLAATVTRWSGTRAHLKAHCPAFLATLERTDRHPRLQAVWARHWPSAQPLG